MPYPDFGMCAAVLDYRRLGKQRVEALQIGNAIRGESRGWRSHPCVRMWEGYLPALLAYQNAMVLEWGRRGYRNVKMGLIPVDGVELPPWMGDERVHSSHRAALLLKDPEWYGQFGWKESPGYDYFWP